MNLSSGSHVSPIASRPWRDGSCADDRCCDARRAAALRALARGPRRGAPDARLTRSGRGRRGRAGRRDSRVARPALRGPRGAADRRRRLRFGHPDTARCRGGGAARRARALLPRRCVRAARRAGRRAESVERCRPPGPGRPAGPRRTRADLQGARRLAGGAPRVRGGRASGPQRSSLPGRSRRALARPGTADGGGRAAAAGAAPQAALGGNPPASRDGAPARARPRRYGPRIYRGPPAGGGEAARRNRTTGAERQEDPMRRWIAGAAALTLAVALVAVLPRLGLTKVQGELWTDRPATTAAHPPAASPWVELARTLKPAVVNISTKRVDEKNPFFEEFLGGRPRRTLRSLGSGFVINPSGLIVTNNHVVDGATEIKLTLADERELPGRVLGRDPKTDIALLKVDATGLPVVPLGDSSRLQVGEPVMAIGNPFGLEQTVTTGIVSATGRVIGEGPYDDFIQTDASINPGNSGGPLLNVQGQAIGINAAIFTQTGGSVGIGFAIPVNLSKPVLAQLAGSGHVVRGYLGVAVQRVTSDLAKSFRLFGTDGALVTSVAEGSPAAKAGLKEGDVIVEYDGRPVARAGDLPRTVAETPVGREVPVTVLRDGKTVKLTAKVAKLDEPDQKVASDASEKGKLGVAVEPVTPAVARELGLKETRGVAVRRVEDGGRAANAGIRSGDVS